MLRIIGRKLGYGAFYVFIKGVIQWLVGAALPMYFAVGVLIGDVAVAALSYSFRVGRGELRREYLSGLEGDGGAKYELCYMRGFGEFWAESIMAAIYFTVTELAYFAAGEGFYTIDLIINIIIFVVADIIVWAIVHNKWKSEHIERRDPN